MPGIHILPVIARHLIIMDNVKTQREALSADQFLVMGGFFNGLLKLTPIATRFHLHTAKLSFQGVYFDLYHPLLWGGGAARHTNFEESWRNLERPKDERGQVLIKKTSCSNKLSEQHKTMLQNYT